YNVHAGAGADNAFDLDRQADVIASWDADIIGLQEVDVHWAARSQWRDMAGELAAALGMRGFFGHIYDLDPPAADKPRRQYGVAILTKHPIVYARNHSITRLSTQTPNPTPEPAPGFPEVAVNVAGAIVHVFNTHLDYRADPSVRQMQVADTLRIMDEAGQHGDAGQQAGAGRQQILLGDFNAPPHAPELAPLWERLVDTWSVSGGVPGLTYPAANPVKRIDYVAVSKRVKVRGVQVPGTLASDHLPVVADLTLTRGQNGES
ncbi:MAG: endonuclease/exonuclease/phosphatase family protein, partial [Micromonosporaceae bacterium]